MKSRNPNLCRCSNVFLLAVNARRGCGTAPGHRSYRPVHYHITDLGTLGGPFSEATSVASDGLISGAATLANGTQHATLWFKGLKLDLGTPGFDAKNSAKLNSTGFTTNDFAQVVGVAEVSPQQKDSENFCGFGTGLKCVPFLWEDGAMTTLPLLGGKNGQAISINDRGQAVGVAEEGAMDTHCVAPQTNDFEAAIWGPGRGEVQKLRPLPGDSVGIGLWVNDKGQVVGQSGSCGNTLLPPLAVGPHAVLWENGTVTDLGDLGGKCLVPCKSAALGPLGNTALFINNQGQVVGTSVLTGEETQHAFLWTRDDGYERSGYCKG